MDQGHSWLHHGGTLTGQQRRGCHWNLAALALKDATRVRTDRKAPKKKRPTKHDKTIFKIWTTYLNLWKLVLAGPANQKACHQVNSSHLAKQLWPRWYPPPSAGLQWRTATGARRQHTGSAEADAGSAGSCGGDGSQQLPSRLPLWNVKSCRAHGPSILRYECIYWCHVIPQTAETPLACYLAGAHR